MLLRAKLAPGSEQARRGEYGDQTVSEIIKEAKQQWSINKYKHTPAAKNDATELAIKYTA